MKSLKHIGRLKNTGAKVVVVFRTLPGDSGSALVLPVAQLKDEYHDSLMTLLETDQAQDTFEFGEIMFHRHFTDGRPMLTAMQQDGRLHKVATSNVAMTPTHNNNIDLSELNVLIAEQKNVSVDDLASLTAGGPKVTEKSLTAAEKTSKAVVEPVLQATENAVLTDSDIAKGYRSQADAMYKEAARLRREADLLDPPTKKVASKVKETEGA